ncbi:hypothetical protein J6590_056808 [Homalodisca vitripennis]|nr:hypothetical protein J6590_056808 [Homalodisca vitripennis]
MKGLGTMKFSWLLTITAVTFVCFINANDVSSSSSINGLRISYPTHLSTGQGGEHGRKKQTTKAEEIKEFVTMMKDGVDFGKSLLDLAKWPLDVAMSLLGSWIGLLSSFISLFDFLASFVSPGGSGASLLKWLRGGSSATSTM